MNKKYRTGFTLMELILYTAVFGAVSGLLTTILITTTRITNNQVVSTQVSDELNLVLNTVQSLVRGSSNIECVSSSNCTVSSGSYLKLRFQDSTLDPTCVYLSGTQILVARGPNATNNQNCTATTQALTTDKVNVNSLTFTKFDIPGGKTTVQIDATLTYNSTNPDLQISRTLRSAIGRVSAATFDSDLLPDVTNSRSIGNISTPRAWRNVFLSGVLGLGTATDAQESGVTTTTGGVYFNTTGNTVKVYNGTTWQNVGGSQTPWLQNISAAGFTLFGNSTASGVLTLDSTSHATKGNIILNPTSGNVGIGTTTPAAKLEVAGGVKIGNDAATCNASKAGTMRWDGTNFRGCNGSTWVVFGSFNIEYLVVAGGGASISGGGGAGGMRTATGFSVTTGATYSVTVGAGGVASNGSDSVFSSITSTGGGRGGGINEVGWNGGSGGGGGGNPVDGAPGGTGIAGQGHAGAWANANGSGGGGGAGGGGGTPPNVVPGPGLASSITGTSVVYAAGSATTTANTGNGGGGNGSSGIVILRWVNTFNPATATTGTVTYTNVGGFHIYRFTASGTITI